MFEEGERVWRKKPSFARPPKQLMADPVHGPYEVVKQSTNTSVVLKDPATGELVDNGANKEAVSVNRKRSDHEIKKLPVEQCTPLIVLCEILEILLKMLTA